ncbi:TPA: hypothetical protein IAB29_06800 [Candidatus Ventrenecus stercoripullorum]|nr:hypothetical protein [Candidatus Ventrenecus stercoripullorum]
MGSGLTKVKRFIGNKNTVTILCVVAGIAVLYIGYNYRVSSAINPTTVPYAKNTLEARHVITVDDIGYMEVNSDVVSKSDNLITNGNELVGKEVTYGNTIQQNSLFYDGDITEPNLSPDYVLSDIEDGYTAFSLSVDTYTTYGNAIAKGDYIDLWFNGEDDTNKIIYTNLVKSIRVLDVRDSAGVSLEHANSTGEPAELLFAVPDDMYSLLVKAQQVGTLEPVPRNRNYTADPGETEVVSEYVVQYVLSKSVTIPDENTSSGSNSNSTTNNTNSNNTNNNTTN